MHGEVLVAGSGLFAGLSFHPLVRTLIAGSYTVRDFTRGAAELPARADLGVPHDVGRYNERRRAMYTSSLFGAESAWSEGQGSERRDIHLGVDVGGDVGTSVHAVAAGVVHSSGYNSAPLDYGHVVVVEHTLAGRAVWALYGHLSALSTEQSRPGMRLAGGDVVGWLGDTHENGGWPPHVHFQLSLEEPRTHDMPGVVSDAQYARALEIYPDPRMCLGPLYPGDGLFE